MHLDLFREEYVKTKTNSVFVNKIMNNIFLSSSLTKFILDKCNNIEEFMELRQYISSNYASVMFLHYIEGNTPKLDELYLDVSKGLFMV